LMTGAPRRRVEDKKGRQILLLYPSPS
jgi:hypothetical protein